MLRRYILLVLAILLFSATAFLVTCGFALLIGSMGDQAAAKVLRWVAGGLGLVTVALLVSLVVLVACQTVFHDHGSQAE